MNAPITATPTFPSLQSGVNPVHDPRAVWAPRLLGVVRIVTGLLFVAHGSAKLLGHPHFTMFDDLPLFSLVGVAGMLELVGGSLIVLGLMTRPAAFILSGEMAVAYFMVHAPQGFLPLTNQGEAAVLYCFVFLYFSVVGPGALSIDAARQKVWESIP